MADDGKGSQRQPLDALNKARDKRVIVKVKPHGGEEESNEIAGTLKAFDLHLNLWLEGAEKLESDKKTKLGTIVIRGDNVLFVSPE